MFKSTKPPPPISSKLINVYFLFLYNKINKSKTTRLRLDYDTSKL